jgi:hypothetical protein
MEAICPDCKVDLIKGPFQFISALSNLEAKARSFRSMAERPKCGRIEFYSSLPEQLGDWIESQIAIEKRERPQ